jgi:hypothetical protein
MAFKSGFERTLDQQLKVSGVKYSYETTQIPYILNGTYNPDFTLSNGILIEAKGLLDRESKRKMAAVKELDIRFVFYQADKKIPGSKQTHGVWATKNGFPWADGSIPKEWLVE